MNTLTFSKINQFSEIQYKIIKKIYLDNNSKADEASGNEIILNFITVKSCNKRIKEGSLFYELIVDDKVVGIFEIEKNHLTLLYIKNEYQKNHLGSICINFIKILLKNQFNKISVFASPYSHIFYQKNNFNYLDKKIHNMKGIKFYKMEMLF